MVQLKLYTYDHLGNELVTRWSFNALDDQDSFDITRESEAAVNGEPRRRPFDEREVRTITLGAGLLKSDGDWQSFKRMLRAHRIEWYREVGNTAPATYKWLRYALDEETRVTFERLEEVTRLRRHKITLVQVDALTFQDFENTSAQLANSRTLALPSNVAPA